MFLLNLLPCYMFNPLVSDLFWWSDCILEFLNLSVYRNSAIYTCCLILTDWAHRVFIVIWNLRAPVTLLYKCTFIDWIYARVVCEICYGRSRLGIYFTENSDSYTQKPDIYFNPKHSWLSSKIDIINYITMYYKPINWQASSSSWFLEIFYF